ncbi:5-methylthioadenosine/S-adenosylhomocysteine deaminase [Amycolatopsis xylanica]|uniref:5-methylthioadenosine/S-adenosylhomocysteine deaminase n=1 Tax=Amycolatopsis xylanica TaxID=589385 RepID=A0A1H3DCT6_9PSEU|nr:amidohydrolase family protein [Amycolatopsis xylanica]SDX64235.1 5-methylthioadenosine/S-adenosylhomocysteine deaminase [Amycolatopsis xylanica]
MKQRSPVFAVFTLTLALVLGAFLLAKPSGNEAPSGSAGGGKYVIRGASMVLTMDPKLGEGPLGSLADADVLIEDTKIKAVGKNLDAGRAQVVDGRGKIVMPGFVDLHNHLWQALIRGCAGDKELNGWLGKCVLPLYKNQPTDADGYAGARLATLDVISTGITTVTDWSHAFNADFAKGNLRALGESNLRFVFSYNGTTNAALQDEIRRVKREVIDKNPLAHLEIGTHPSTGNFPSLDASEKLARELGVPLNVHLLESKADPATGQMEALRKAGALRSGLVANHVIQATDAELDELAAADVRVAHNPLSNMRLASGVIRLPEMKKRGMKVGLGLDGGTNDTSDMFNVMRAAVGLQRATATDPGVYPTTADVLRMATLGGAEALGLDGEVGSLTPGKKADLQVINAQSVNFAPRVDWVNQLVFNTQPSNVDWVFVDGRALKRDGKLVGVDTGRVVKDAQDAADRLKKLLPQ